ncbi:MAG: hypothetical protein HKN20_15920, partial [Gemmatimonadetes bacterium]|nr:hypothetical protein [Gemmatimonadota bacterium]
MSARTLLAMVALLAAGSPGPVVAETDGPSPRVYRLGRGAVQIAGEDRTGPYTLPHRLLYEDSEEVVFGGTLLVRETDYWLRNDAGTITFRETITPRD